MSIHKFTNHTMESEKHTIINRKGVCTPKYYVPILLKRGHKELSQNETPLYTALLQHAKKSRSISYSII